MGNRFIELDGARFHVREWGEADAPVVVLLHGVLLPADVYGVTADRLAAAGLRVLGFDQRGHGQSAHLNDYTWQAFVSDLARLWSALDLGSVDVIGHSMGGQNAARFAATHPDAVRRLVMVDSPFAAEPSPDEPAFWAAVGSIPTDFASRQEFVEIAQQVFPRSQLDALELHATLLADGEGGRVAFRHLPDFGVLAHDAPPAAEDWRLCGQVQCPALLVRAQHSELVTPAGAAQIVAAFANGSGAELAGSGHMVQWENPAGVAEIALAFLS